MEDLPSQCSSWPLSLAIPPWVDAMIIGNGFGRGRNCKFCVTVGPVIWSAIILAYCKLASLGLTLIDSKVKGDELRRDGPHSLCVNLLLLLALIIG